MTAVWTIAIQVLLWKIARFDEGFFVLVPASLIVVTAASASEWIAGRRWRSAGLLVGQCAFLALVSWGAL